MTEIKIQNKSITTKVSFVPLTVTLRALLLLSLTPGNH